jgi:hypothetical protein
MKAPASTGKTIKIADTQACILATYGALPATGFVRLAGLRTSAIVKENATDTSADAQRYRMLHALRQGPVTTFYAREVLNILMPAARIKELRAIGYEIETVRIELVDRHGRRHSRVAKYVLFAEPNAGREAA